ncbi:MAG: type II toxin-antitoxin system VapC family toxin [Candidatus Daviesbacteria bacterium]|nr:type II toxin-antitoxin system VapC family toxin [Candidatus Daviesbacteria bacterium]
MTVIDASVANKLFLPHEEGHFLASKIFRNHILQTQETLVPEFLFYEVANTLVTKGIISLWKITNALTRLYQIDLHIYHPVEKDLKDASRLAKKYHTSVYDMLYAVVAKKYKARLITADEKFAGATKFKFVQLLKDIH